MCRECKGIVFGKRDFARESTKTPKYVGIYQVLPSQLSLLIPEHVSIPSRNRATPPKIPIPRILTKVVPF